MRLEGCDKRLNGCNKRLKRCKNWLEGLTKDGKDVTRNWNHGRWDRKYITKNWKDVTRR